MALHPVRHDLTYEGQRYVGIDSGPHVVLRLTNTGWQIVERSTGRLVGYPQRRWWQALRWSRAIAPLDIGSDRYIEQIRRMALGEVPPKSRRGRKEKGGSPDADASIQR